MKRISLIVSLLSLICVTTSAKTTNNQSKLFLVGGGLKTCSSMSIKNCKFNTVTNELQIKEGKKGALYQIDKKTINLVKKTWPEHFNLRNQKKLIRLLTLISKQEKQKLLSKSNLRTLFKKYDNQRITHQINDAEYYLLLDLLEQPVLEKNTTVRLKEGVALTQSTNVFSTEIYQNFVVSAQQLTTKTAPKILVLTASARDPFEAVDFYQSAFTQAGGDTEWLPLDATLNTLIQKRGNRNQICQNLAVTRLAVQGSANREFIYPDLVKQQLEYCLFPEKVVQAISQADGIFINGGDQSLTLKAFINYDGSDNEALKMIKEKLASNSLIIGGTSAGTAVMSGGVFSKMNIPMITNGQSNVAIIRGAKKDALPQEGCQKSNSCNKDLLSDDLTFNSKGGLGLFHWGILDTHFSERGRQGRLATLALETNTHFSFGVDEATALIVSNINSEQPTFEISGQSGVFIIENSNNSSNKKAVLSHYLTTGDNAILAKNKLQVTFAAWKASTNEEAEIPKDIVNVFFGKRYKQTAELLCRTNNESIVANSEWQNYNTQVFISKLTNSKSNYGILSKQKVKNGYCSYQNYQMSLVRK